MVEEYTKVSSCLAYTSTLEMETTCSSETSVNFHRTTLHYIPEDINLPNIYFLCYLIQTSLNERLVLDVKDADIKHVQKIKHFICDGDMLLSVM
jgi:hypothetical protein